MPRRDVAPRDLLFGLLALQNGLVTRDQLLMAFSVWTAAPDRALADLLSEQGALRPEHRPVLDALADAHLKLHGSDPEKSLAALDLNRSTREILATAGGPEIEATLARVGTDSDGASERTASYAASTTHAGSERFRVLRPHARGGLGAVFVALDSELNREVALKQILDHHADDPVRRTRFLVEAEITGGLEHPGIVPVYGLGTYDGGRPYYAMRFIRGDNLKEEIERFHAGTGGSRVAGSEPAKPRSPRPDADPGLEDSTPGRIKGASQATRRRGLELRRLLRRFLDVCNAIEYAHSRGVLHRDIKPANVIVGTHGETLVVDWGLAKPLGRVDPAHDAGERTLMPSSASGSAETLPGSALGTPAYMSPEQAAGDLNRLGPRSDVYSLGATLYCLLTGRPPFQGEVGEVLRKVQGGEVTPPRQVDPSIDKALEAVCLKAMATRPEERYASCRALADDVERWTADEPLAAYHEPWTRTLIRWLTRHRTGVTAAAAAVLVGTVGLAAVLVVQTAAKVELEQANARLSDSLSRERSANEALSVANADLAHSRAAIEARYNLAVNAIRTFHTGVTGDFLFRQDQFKELCNRLLKSAQNFYGKLSTLLGKETDPAARRALAASNFELARLTANIGSREEALKAHRAVLADRVALAAQPGAGPALAADVARSLVHIGIILRETGRSDEALAAFERAIATVSTGDGSPPHDNEARAALAEALESAGWMRHVIGRDAEGLKALQQARDLLLDLSSATPGNNEWRLRLASTHNNIGILLTEAGQPAEALRAFEAARAIREKLVRDNPDVTLFQNDLAISHGNIASILVRRGQPAEALRAYETARAIWEKLVRDGPAVTGLQSYLADTHGNIGILLAEAGQPTEALRAFETARAIREKLVRDNPDVTLFQNGLADNHNKIAGVLLMRGQPAEALQAYGVARVIEEKLVRDYPRVPHYRLVLSMIHGNIGEVLLKQGRPSEARAAYEKGLALGEPLSRGNPKNPVYQSITAFGLRGRGLARLGQRDVAGATEDTRRALVIWDRMPSRRGSEWFETACCHAALSGLAGRDGAGLTADEGVAEADRAMATLRQAVAAGYRSPDGCRTEIAFDPLRNRDDFKLLLMDMAMPSDPFTEAR